VVVNVELFSTRFNIPDLDLVVKAGGGQDVVGRGVEGDGTSLSGVTIEDLGSVGHVLGKTTLRNLPDLNGAIFRGGGKDVVVEGREGNIKNGSLVARDGGELTELTSGL